MYFFFTTSSINCNIVYMYTTYLTSKGKLHNIKAMALKEVEKAISCWHGCLA